MRISLHWLKEYVDVTVSPAELAERLTMVGLEVESVERIGEKYDGFVVGEVLEVRKHPNADKLSLCRVNVGTEVLQIVCGAPNVRQGQRVPVGIAGAVVPHNQHDPEGRPFTLSQVKVRGEDSFGMICSPYELDLGDDRSGIMVLDNSAVLGEPLARHLGLDDTVFEIGVTPNRPDALSHVGIAREVAALLGKKLVLPSIKVKEEKEPIRNSVRITIEDSENCPRYTARLVRKVSVGPSPKWLQDRLTAVGVRPINNVVDVTNFVLMETGQPLHAFDFDLVSGGSIIVKQAKEGEEFVTLDGKKHTLRSDVLMIDDPTRHIAIAGVMGGQNSEISDTTKNVLIESAHFNPRSIRRTSKYLGISTDASQRFERGADPNGTRWAADRAAQLLREIAGGEICRGVIDVYPKKVRPKVIVLRPQRVNQLLDTTLSAKTISALLHKLEINVTGKVTPSRLSFQIPTHRPDIQAEIDLVEEVARAHGYEKIETKSSSSIALTDSRKYDGFEDSLRSWLFGSGYQEIVTNSLQDTEIAAITSTNAVALANPLNKEMAVLRTSLVPGHLTVLRHNISHGNKDLRLFELGKTYRQIVSGSSNELENFQEEKRVVLVISGSNAPLTWGQTARSVDLYDMRGEVETLLCALSLDKVKFIPYSTAEALTDDGLSIENNGEQVGYLGRVRKEILTRFEIEQPVLFADLSYDVLEKIRTSNRVYEPLPRFPSVWRDIAFVVDHETPAAEVEKIINSTKASHLRGIRLFDVYVGNPLPAEKKSLAFALEFQSREHTLTQQEVDRSMKEIITEVSRKLQATVRM